MGTRLMFQQVSLGLSKSSLPKASTTGLPPLGEPDAKCGASMPYDREFGSGAISPVSRLRRSTSAHTNEARNASRHLGDRRLLRHIQLWPGCRDHSRITARSHLPVTNSTSTPRSIGCFPVTMQPGRRLPWKHLRRVTWIGSSYS
jgi:hypothetical protein